MSKIRSFNKLLNVLNCSCALSHKRSFSFSSNLSKKYKYALDAKKQRSSGNGLSQYRKSRKGAVVEGVALSYFSFNSVDETESSVEESPKQRAYAEIVQFAVESLLTSKDLPRELQDILIEIVHVEIGACLTSATIVWKIPDYSDCKYSKEETETLLEKHLPELRLLLPAYSSVTQTPTIWFVYDSFSEKQKEIDKLFDIVKKEEEEYMKSAD